MPALFALVATALTSFLPILNKQLLRDARPAQVAWVTNGAARSSSANRPCDERWASSS
jgi:hypothetical protein